MKNSAFIKVFIFYLLFLCMFFVACNNKNEIQRSLVIASPHPIAFITPLIENFEYDTGIEVSVIQAGTGEILHTLSQNLDGFYCDIVWGGSYSSVLPTAHLFQDYQSANEQWVDVSFKNIEGSLTRFSDIPSVLMVNKKLLGNIRVDGYEDLLQAELKGKIAFSNPKNSSSSWEHVINIVHAMDDGTSAPKTMDAGWNYVKKFCENLDGKLLSSSSEVYKGVSEGKYAVGLTFEEGGANYAETDENIVLVYMKEGVVFTPDGVYIAKNAQSTNNAQRFVDYITSAEAQTYMAQTLNRRPVRNDVSAKSFLVDKSGIHTINVDYAYLAQVRTEWLDRFAIIWEESTSE